jgi:lysine 6-dehydrogenase
MSEEEAPKTPTYKYGVIGAGRQGTAAAYDMVMYGDADEVRLADVDYDAAKAAAQRVNDLTGRDVANAWHVDVNQIAAVVDMLYGLDVFLSAVPYHYNLSLSRAALQAGASMVDMGGSTDVVLDQIALDEQAQAAGISIVPDCGMGPGMNNTLAAYAIELLDEPREIYIWDGGLPQDPQPPWNFQLTFHINGLTSEYYGQTAFLRDGKITMVDTFEEYQEIDFEPLGRLEAFITSGGTSTAPWTWQGKLQAYENRTLRYPGHYQQFKTYKLLGLFETDPVTLSDGTRVAPRDLYHALLEPKITAPDIRDVCVIRVKGVGVKDGKETAVVIDMLDYYDEETGFRAMERMTGWHCSIMASLVARGRVRKGAVPQEICVPASEVVAEARRRGFNILHRFEPVA